MSPCSVVECETKVRSRGYCNRHYQRWRRHGDPNWITPGHENRSGSIAERIAAYTHRRGTCLIYSRGKPSRSGHRLISHDGKTRLVHRVAWELVKGPIPPGLCVLHRCDVPACVNVDHLFLGTVADNNHDRDRKGRQVALRGSRKCQAKLTEWKVQQIRQRHAAGEPIMALAREFGVSQRAVQFVVRGKTWRHVQLPEPVAAA